MASEMPRAVGWRVRWMRGSEAAWRSRAVVICGVGGAVVDEAQLPVGVGLVADGGDGLFEHGQGWVVDGGEHRDERSARGDRGAAGYGGGGWRGQRGCLGVESAGSTHTARDVMSRQAPGAPGVDGESSAVARPGRRVDLVSSWPSAVAGGQLLGPQLATAPGPQRDGHRARTVPVRSRQSWGSSIARPENVTSLSRASGKVMVSPAAMASERP